MPSSEDLVWLQTWYASHCDGEWEHQGGIDIHTLDNPGWRLRVRIIDTELRDAAFNEVRTERSETDWFRCWRTEEHFEAACGAMNLTEVVSIFRSFAEPKAS